VFLGHGRFEGDVRVTREFANAVFDFPLRIIDITQIGIFSRTFLPKYQRFFKMLSIHLQIGVLELDPFPLGQETQPVVHILEQLTATEKCVLGLVA
jgi:hypothetical protein